MPIINRQDAAEVEQDVARFFAAAGVGRVQALRRLFVEKLDFNSAAGSVSLANAPKNVALPPSAERIASMEGLHVVYVPLSGNGPNRIRKAEATAAAKLIADALHGDLLLVMTNPSCSQLHVIYPTFVGAAPSLRRMIIERDLPRRTAVQQLSNIFWQWKDTGSIGHAVEKAFDVEAVTKQFFEEYKRVFDSVIASVKGFGPTEDEAKKLFVQTLFNRLMFIYFLSRKGWLRFKGDPDYLNALWRTHQADKGGGMFYSNRLALLFFTALNNPQSFDLRKNNPAVWALIGDVPFLNGGLFEETPDDKRTNIVVPDTAIDQILRDLFDRYNFTVMESTPFDTEVAIDPEMLGKVFEELVTGRHESGSYYTPRPVVSFMCREALKGYLEIQNTGASTEAIAAFVDYKDTSGLTISSAPKIGEALARVKVVDPACGSGAYLLGMMQELVELMTALYSAQLSHQAQDLYNLKLRIIQQNLYGADIDQFAVNIAMLRLWLSLAIEYDGPVPPPLPNLDFKIVRGDSLLGPDPSPENYGTLFRHRVHQLAGQLADFKDKHIRATGQEKTNLTKDIEGLKAQLHESLADSAAPEGVVDWRVEFAEVFDQNGGFDMVLANPPYVRADAQFKHLSDEDERQASISKWKEYRRALLEGSIYQTLYEKWDLYVPFLERAHQLLRTNGRMVFIISDAYNSAKYARKSHEFFLSNALIKRIDFCTDIPLFEAGISNTIVHFARTAPVADDQPMRVKRWGQSSGDFEQNSQILPTGSQGELGVAVFRPDIHAMVQLGSEFIPLNMICYISYGLRPSVADRYRHEGLFITRELVQDYPDALHPKPYVEGKDVTRWYTRRTRYLEWGTERAPRKFYTSTFPELYQVPEKVIALVVASRAPVAYDTRQLVTTHTSCIFVPWHLLRGVVNVSISKTANYRWQSVGGDREERDGISQRFQLKYILAVMNSSFAKAWIDARRRSKVHVYPDDWKALPIAFANTESQLVIVDLVDQILAIFARKGYPLSSEDASELASLEAQIDQAVKELYKS